MLFTTEVWPLIISVHLIETVSQSLQIMAEHQSVELQNLNRISSSAHKEESILLDGSALASPNDKDLENNVEQNPNLQRTR